MDAPHTADPVGYTFHGEPLYAVSRHPSYGRAEAEATERRSATDDVRTYHDGVGVWLVVTTTPPNR